MANITTHTTAAPLRDRLQDNWAQFTAAFDRWFEAQSRRRARRDRIDALQAQSDAGLARLGLSRDTIVHHLSGTMIHR